LSNTANASGDFTVYLSRVKAHLEKAMGSRLRGIVATRPADESSPDLPNHIELLVLIDSPISICRELKTILGVILAIDEGYYRDRPVMAIPIDNNKFQALEFPKFLSAKENGIWA